MESTPKCSGEQTDQLKEWESRVGCDVKTKEAAIQRKKEEQARLEAEIRQFMSQNGQLEQSIKAERDETKKIKEEDKAISEFISESEARIKLLQSCASEQADCFEALSLAQNIANSKKGDTRVKLEVETTNYEDKVKGVTAELDKVTQEVEMRTSHQLQMSNKVENDSYSLKNAHMKVDLEMSNASKQFESMKISISEAEQMHTAITVSLENTEAKFNTLEQEQNNLRQTVSIIAESNEHLDRNLDKIKRENYEKEVGQAKLRSQIESLCKDLEEKRLEKHNVIVSIEAESVVTKEIEDMNARFMEIAQAVHLSEKEAERLHDVKERMNKAELEKNDILANIDSMSKAIHEFEEALVGTENFESEKRSLEEAITSRGEEIKKEENKRNELACNLHDKTPLLENIHAELSNKEAALRNKNEILAQKEFILENEINPKEHQLNEMREIAAELEVQIEAKENEKRETLGLVSRRTNALDTESKANLAALKNQLDHSLSQGRELAAEVGNLQNAIESKRQYCLQELEKLKADEERKVDLAVSPVLEDYEKTKLAELESAWKPFKSPPTSRRIQFSTKGLNLETASPFDIVLDSQDKTNKEPRRLVIPVANKENIGR